MAQTKMTSLIVMFAMLPVMGWAFEPIADGELSSVTGQDGITLTISTDKLSWDQVIYDRDGVPDNGNGQAAVLGIPTSLAPGVGSALVMKGIALEPGGAIVTTIDAGQSTVGAVLNINMDIPDGTKITLPDLQLAKPTTALGWELDINSTKTILSAGTTANPGIVVELGATNMNMQLGNVAQTLTIGSNTYKPLLLTDLAIKKGIHIENMAITDVSDPNSSTYDYCGTTAAKEACSQTVAHTYINDNSGTLAATKGVSDLTVNGLAMSVTTNGLAFTVSQVGYRDGSGVDHGINVQMDNIHLGDASVPGLGNAYLKGLTLAPASVLTISGH